MVTEKNLVVNSCDIKIPLAMPQAHGQSPQNIFPHDSDTASISRAAESWGLVHTTNMQHMHMHTHTHTQYHTKSCTAHLKYHNEKETNRMLTDNPAKGIELSFLKAVFTQA